MVALMLTDEIPNPVAAIIACLLMGKFRCIDAESAYKAIHWPSIILIVGMMPFALALQKTGGVDLIVKGLMDVGGGYGPYMMMVCLFIMCATIGLFISNTATAVLMAPIALAMAKSMGVSPYPFAMMVAMAASAAFMTPVSSPVNTLVLGPGIIIQRFREDGRAVHRAGDGGVRGVDTGPVPVLILPGGCERRVRARSGKITTVNPG
jgi:di/tricarboxylate transporter